MLRFLQFSFSRTVAVTGIAMNDGTPGISATSFHSRSKYRGCGGGAAKPAMRSKGGAPAKRPLSDPKDGVTGRDQCHRRLVGGHPSN